VVAALPGGILRGLDLLTALAPQDADEAAHRMLRPARGFDNLGERRALPASSSQSPLLLVGPRFGRTLLGPVRVVAWPLGGRDVGRRLRNVRGLTRYRLPVRATAALRFVNFFTGFGSSKGATPAEFGPFRRQLGQLLRVRKRLRFVGAGWESGMSGDVVLLSRLLLAVVTFIPSMRRHSQVKTPWRIFFIFCPDGYNSTHQTIRFAILMRPGRRIELCGDAPRAPTQGPGFGGCERKLAPASPGILAIKR
jgi:hypothetical protein